MRASQATLLLSIAAAVGLSCLPAVRGQCAAPGGAQYSGDMACDLYGGRPEFQPQAQPQEEEPCANEPMGGLFRRIRNHECCGNRWNLAAEGIALQRNATRSQSLYDVGTTATEAFNAKNFEFPVEAGVRLSAIRQLDCEPFAVEVAYFQVDGFAASESVPGQSLMVTDANGPHFIVNDGVARYTSALYVGDVNLRWQCFDRLTLLGGFRMGQLNEHYHAAGAGAGSGEAVTLDVDAFNHLYGFQLGADADVIDFGGPLKVKALCRAGAFGNFASQNNRRVDAGFSDESLNANRDDHIAFLGEAGVVLTYEFTKHLSFRASAEAMWLEGVALAPEQIGSTNFIAGTADIDTNGGVFYYGGGLGLEYKF
ncbi:MAG: hypothetical protein ABFC96_06835 [Thermoguttaceae bacterium]